MRLIDVTPSFSGCYLNEESLKHINFYLSGFLVDLAAKPSTTNPSDYPMLESIAKDFQKLLDDNYVAVYGKAAP